MADVSQNLIHGLKPVLETLRLLEPELYKQVQKDLKDKAEPLRLKVAQGFPDKPWQSSGPIYWTMYGRTKRGRKLNGEGGASFPKYEPAKVRRSVAVQIGGRKIRRTNSYPIMRIKQTNAGGVIYDLAKDNRTTGKQQFVKNLNKSGQPSRVMWKKVRENVSMVENDIERIVDQLMTRFSAQIAMETERRAQASIRASQQVRNALGQFGKFVR